MKAILGDYLIELEPRIIPYSIHGADEEYSFPVSKAVEYRNIKGHNQLQDAESDYKVRYRELIDEQKAEANEIHDAHFASTLLKIDEIEVALQEAQAMLSRQP